MKRERNLALPEINKVVARSSVLGGCDYLDDWIKQNVTTGEKILVCAKSVKLTH
jgi:predicted peroxiredoxin